jgi:hypothetical protein
VAIGGKGSRRVRRLRRLFASSVVLVLLAPGCSSSGDSSADSTVPVDPTTAASVTPPTSEVGGPADATAFAAWFESRPGTAEQRCVDVDQLRKEQKWSQLVGADSTPITNPGGTPVLILDVRSGDIVAGNFADLSGAGSPGDADFEMKIYWVPEDSQLANREPLTVTVTDLHGTRADTTSRFDGAWQVRADGVNSYFWASGVPLPESGRWRVTAQAPGVWGCFELTI